MSLNPDSLNSLATGPNILFPIGSLSLLISATALSLNLRYEPSFLATPFLVLTITALATSPFLNEEVVETDLIAITTLSPTPAFFHVEPLRILMTFHCLAPELSAITTSDSVCNIFYIA
jgi:hypothetical protein